MFSLLFFRNKIDTKILRTPGVLTQKVEGNKLSNLYNYTITNKVNKNIDLTFKLKGSPAEIKLIGNEKLSLPANDKVKGSFFLILPKNLVPNRESKFIIETYEGSALLDESKITFFNDNQ
jgi:hypothetical protein